MASSIQSLYVFIQSDPTDTRLHLDTAGSELLQCSDDQFEQLSESYQTRS